MSDFDIITMYIAAAVSAAIFAVYQIYIPAVKIIEEKASKDERVATKLNNFLKFKYTFGAPFFAFVVMLIFPILIMSLISESSRQSFVRGFVDGVCQ